MLASESEVAQQIALTVDCVVYLVVRYPAVAGLPDGGRETVRREPGKHWPVCARGVELAPPLPERAVGTLRERDVLVLLALPEHFDGFLLEIDGIPRETVPSTVLRVAKYLRAPNASPSE